MATKPRGKGNDPALPDAKEDGTNIGERNTAGGDGSIADPVDAKREPVPEPEPASKPKSAPKPRGRKKAEEPEPASGVIRVRGLQEPGRIAFAEVSARHPGGQVVIIGTAEADVALTFRVSGAIADGQIERV